MKLRASIHTGIYRLLLLTIGLLRPQPVLAQPASPITLASVNVDIWPEYDQPSVLVIETINLSPQVTLPATITLRIPAAASKPHALAMQDVAGLYTLNYDLSAAGDWINVQFTTPVPQVRLEYYDPSLQKSGVKRDFNFAWPGDYAVENLTLRVQQPVNVTRMIFRPDLGAGQPGSDGLTYYTLMAGKVNAGVTFTLAASYDKPDDVLTNKEAYAPAQPNQSIGSSTSGRVVVDQILPWIIGGVGLLLVAAGLFWYWRSGTVRTGQVARAEPLARPRHARRSAEPDLGLVTATRAASKPSAGSRKSGTTNVVKTAEEDGQEVVFCNQCGKKAGPGDAFCRACGTKLRA